MPHGPQAGKRAGLSSATAPAVALANLRRHHGAMVNSEESSANRRAKVAARQANRKDRSAEALRENLQRRKQQARARSADATNEDKSEGTAGEENASRPDPA